MRQEKRFGQHSFVGGKKSTNNPCRLRLYLNNRHKNHHKKKHAHKTTPEPDKKHSEHPKVQKRNHALHSIHYKDDHNKDDHNKDEAAVLGLHPI